MHEVELDVVVDWQLRTCTNYTKTINWIDFGEDGSVTVFDTAEIDQFDFITLDYFSCFQIEEDEDHSNFCTSLNPLSPPLVIYYSP